MFHIFSALLNTLNSTFLGVSCSDWVQ